MLIKSALFYEPFYRCRIELLGNRAFKQPAKYVAVAVNAVARKCTFWIAANSVSAFQAWWNRLWEVEVRI